MGIIDSFDHSALRYPERAAFLEGERTLTYAEARRLSQRVALALMAAGIGRDTKVAVLSENETTAFCCVLGILRAGAVWQAVNARNAVPDTISQMQDFDTAFVIYHSSFEDRLAEMRAQCPGILGAVCIDRPGREAPSLAQWLEGHDGPAPPSGIAADDCCMILGTGGTTGRSKGVMLTTRNLRAMIANFALSVPFETPPVFLMAPPMTHGAGLLALWMLAAGGTLAVLPGAQPRAVMAAIERYRVSILFLPPTVIYMMLADPEVRSYDYSSLRYLYYSAAPMAVDKLKEALRLFGPVLIQFYGQSETPACCTLLAPEDHVLDGDARQERRLASAGRVLPYVELAIMDDDGNILPPEQRGEVVVRGDIVMKGYYRNPEATAEAWKYGWHHTGDIGLLDEDGYLYVVDRKKDMIITGGFNVYPSEIEQVVWSHPAVQDAAVIGVPDEKWGEMVTAVVEAKPGMTVEPDDLIALCRARLGPIKAPKRVLVWDALPRSPVGKVLKRAIRDSFWKGRDRAV